MQRRRPVQPGYAVSRPKRRCSIVRGDNPARSRNRRRNPNYCYGYSAQAVEVEVDLATGVVVVTKIISVHDVGRAINHQQVEAQIEGCLAQAVGYALTENLVVRDGIILTPYFSTYLLPTALDMPVEIVPVILELADSEGPVRCARRRRDAAGAVRTRRRGRDSRRHRRLARRPSDDTRARPRRHRRRRRAQSRNGHPHRRLTVAVVRRLDWRAGLHYDPPSSCRMA